MAKFFSQGYVPKYVDYDKLPRYEGDLVSYYDHLKHKRYDKWSSLLLQKCQSD